MKKADKDKRLIEALRMSTIAVEIAFSIFDSFFKLEIIAYRQLNELLAKEVGKDTPDMEKVENLRRSMSILSNE